MGRMSYLSARSLIRAIVILILCVGVVAIGAPTALRLFAAPYMHTSTIDIAAAETIVVPGASVIRGKPSPVLERRASAAVQLFNAGKAPTILVTGDGRAPNYNEVEPVREYLEAAGVPRGAIVLDTEGYDTYTSMYRAREVFGFTRVVIVTQDFHLPRAIYVARHTGLAAEGFIAAGTERTVSAYVREMPASVKALLDVAFGRVPR
jgi:SanA protein